MNLNTIRTACIKVVENGGKRQCLTDLLKLNFKVTENRNNCFLKALNFRKF